MPRFLIVFASMTLLSAATSAGASVLTETVDVSAQAGPWLQALNPRLPYGTGGNLAPTHTTAAFDFSAGTSFSLTYLSGLATPLSYDGVIYDGRGDTDYVATGTPGTSKTPFPSQYIPASLGKVHLGTLIGAFARDGVVVGNPFAIGNAATVTSPGGVDEILLGYNDDIFGDNRGLLSVRITGVSAVPLPGAAPVFGLALLALGALGLSRKAARASEP